MRNIQIERKLFELFGRKFFVFEDFKDSDLDIDDPTIYPTEGREELVGIFALNQFYAIWEEEKRHHATVICACEGDLQGMMSFCKKIKVTANAFSTIHCELSGDPKVLLLTAKESIRAFKFHVTTSVFENKRPRIFFNALLPLKKAKVSLAK